MRHFYISTSLLILVVVLYMTRYSFVSDHWQYFGCLSVLTLAAAGITRALDWLDKWNRFLKPVLIGTLFLVLGLLTRHHARCTPMLKPSGATRWQKPGLLDGPYRSGHLFA